MKALTLLQPWASLMVTRWETGRFCKMIETRSWTTKYRGPIAIHSSAGMTKAQTELASSGRFKSALAGKATWPLPKGRVLGIGMLTDCLSASTVNFETLRKFAQTSVTEATAECDFGDYSEGRFAWVITDMQPLETPVPTKGMLGLWEWNPTEEVRTILRQMEPF